MTMKRASFVALWLAVSAFAWPSNAAAQSGRQSSDAPRVFVSLSVLSTNRPPGPQDYHYITPMFGGTTVGVAGSVGFFLTPRFSLGVEVSRPGTLSGPFNFDHFLRDYATAAHRETLVGPVARWHVAKGRFHVEPLGMLIFARESIRFTDRRDPGGYPNYQVIPFPDVSWSARDRGFGAGVDAVADVTRRLAVTASFRFSYYPSRYVMPAAVEAGNSVGLGNRTMQAGAGLRWTFRK
jgi:hypothetical protein